MTIEEKLERLAGIVDSIAASFSLRDAVPEARDRDRDARDRVIEAD